MADIFDEVEEDLRKDKAEELWKKYGKYVIALAVVIVVATGGYKGWQGYSASKNADMANQFDQAVQAGRNDNYSDADNLLASLASDGGEGYAAISRLQQAAIKVKANDLEGAVAVYDALTADSSVAGIYQDLAVVLSVMHQIDMGNATDLLEKITPQTNDDKAWRFTARELAAILAMRTGDNDLAADLLKRITDDAAAPRSARSRGTELLHAIEG